MAEIIERVGMLTNSFKVLSMVKRPSVGAELHHLDVDKTIATDPVDHSKRRTLKMVKKHNSWGFTLQTYGINHKQKKELEIMTYVDYVDIDGSAWMAGMRRGDVILSVNGEKVSDIGHKQLVAKIKNAGDTLRLVVLFEDCCRKVDLHERFIKLKSVLKSKYQELKEIEQLEMEIVDRYCESKGLNRFEQIRQSILSDNSSGSDSWDAYSVISSPSGLTSTGQFEHGQWSCATSLKSFTVGDNIDTDDDYVFMDSESDGEILNTPTTSQRSSIISNRSVKSHGSDSNLSLRRKHSAGALSNTQKLRFKDIRLSDSTLYRRSIGRSDVDLQGSSAKFKIGSSQSLKSDKVFQEEEQNEVKSEVKPDEVKSNGVKTGELNINGVKTGEVESNEVKAGEVRSNKVNTGEVRNNEVNSGEVENEVKNIEDDYEVIEVKETQTKNESVDSGVEMNGTDGTEQEIERHDQSDIGSQVKDLTLKEEQVFYAGENGKIIVPKICLEGAEMFTTFEHIDISEDLEQNSKSKNSNSYQNKVVAIEIAKEMAKLDQMKSYGKMRDVSDEDIPNTFAKDLNLMKNERNSRTPSPKVLSESSTPTQSRDPSPVSTNGANRLINHSQNNVPHVGASLPYDKFKSSIPDVRVSFHTNQREVIYINDKDEDTKL